MDTTRQCKLRPARGRVATFSLGGILLATLLAAGCGSATTGAGTGAGSGTTTSAGAGAPASSGAAGSSPAIPCAQITSLRTALTQLTETRISVGHAPAIVSDVATMKSQLQALSSQTGGAFSAQAKGLQAELNALETAAKQVVMLPSPAHVRTMTVAVDHLKATAAPLLAEMRSVCPSPGSS
jgi:hypothetical protein